MSKFYVLSKRKSCKNWKVVIPIKKNTSKDKIKKFIKLRASKGFRSRIISQTKLSKYLKKVSKRR